MKVFYHAVFFGDPAKKEQRDNHFKSDCHVAIDVW
jgi:hypothetical protein